MYDEGFRESTEELSERGGSSLKTWVTIIAVIFTWIVSASIQWGFYSAHAQENDRRILTLETVVDHKIDRLEYEARQTEVIDRLKRIENKIDSAKSIK